MRLSDILKDYRSKNNISQRQLAAKCTGVSNGYISMLENGINPTTGKPIVPSIDKLRSIAEAMGMTLSQLIDIADDMDVDISDAEHSTIPSNLKPIRPGSGQRVRIVGEIAAGQPIYMDEDYETYVDSPMKADFALVVRGDSMVPTYLDGDIVYIKAQPAVNNGQIAAVAIDESATLKHVYMTKYGLSLMSDNPNYAPIFVKPEDHEIRILGVVVGFTRMYNASNTRIDISKGITIQ